MAFFKLVAGAVAFCMAVSLAWAQDSELSISQTAQKLVDLRQKKENIEKDYPKAGQTVESLGYLTIDDFLQLEAVPEGLGVSDADKMYQKENSFDFVTQRQALINIQAMREQGVELPEDLEERIKKNPEQKSAIMSEAFDKIPPANLITKEDVDKTRRNIIKNAEETLGIDFKSIMAKQKEMMTPKVSK